MLVSYRWLSRMMGFELPLDELERRMLMAGIEVEGVTDLGAGHGRIVTARILEKNPHPNADNLTLCAVAADRAEPYRIVCGAKNMGPGDVVPLAVEGADLPNGLKIKKSKIRGEASEGMMCSGAEIAWGDDADGLLLLPKDGWYEVGKPFEALIDIKVTPNRPDCLAIYGIARDLAAVCGKEAPKFPESAVAEGAESASAKARVKVEAPDGCPRYAGRVITGVKIGPSPLWLRRAVESAGLRSINNVVDVTNFVMLELGQPLHAFDLDKVAGGEVVVRRARAGEETETLDGQKLALDAGDLVIADKDRTIALAGVMGCGNTEITEATTTVFLECAYFDPASVRRTSRRLGKVTDSSYRFERGVDWEATGRVCDRAARLIAEVSGGTVLAGRLEEGPGVAAPAAIELDGGRLRDLLGYEVKDAEIEGALKALGFALAADGASRWKVTAPAWRPDCSNDADLVEEVARVVGYDRIPSVLPRHRSTAVDESPSERVVAAVRRTLTRLGYGEAVNYSFLRGDTLERCGHRADVRLANPLSAEYAVMRSGLLPGLLETLVYNQNRGNADAALFEVGVVFAPQDPDAMGSEPAGGHPPCAERMQFAAVAAGTVAGGSWRQKARAVDFFDGKGTAEEILRASGVANWSVAAAAGEVKGFEGVGKVFHPGKVAVISAAGRPVMVVGEIHPGLQAELGLARAAAAVIGDVGGLAAAAGDGRAFREIPTLPGVTRDLALLAGNDTPAAAIEEAIAKRAKSLLTGIELFDLYEGERLPDGKRSLAYRLSLHGGDRTLKDEEVNDLMAKIIADLKAKFGVEQR